MSIPRNGAQGMPLLQIEPSAAESGVLPATAFLLCNLKALRCSCELLRTGFVTAGSDLIRVTFEAAGSGGRTFPVDILDIRQFKTRVWKNIGTYGNGAKKMTEFERIRKTIDSYCGLSCAECTYRETKHCGGCIATGGKPFHGSCEVAACAGKKAGALRGMRGVCLRAAEKLFQRRNPRRYTQRGADSALYGNQGSPAQEAQRGPTPGRVRPSLPSLLFGTVVAAAGASIPTVRSPPCLRTENVPI